MNIDRPIFIVGPHRSGTTLLYQLLGRHPDVGYFNRMNRRLRGKPITSHILTSIGMRGDHPMEAQRIWDRFKRRDDDVMTADDASPKEVAWYRNLVGQVLKLRNANRFLAKYPRLSLRLSWIDEVFPGVIFLHMTRDWRAVVNSTAGKKVKRDKRNGRWFGVHIPNWRNLEGISHEVASGRVFRYVNRLLEKEALRFNGRFFTVSYEGLCYNPTGTLHDIADACNLPWDDRFSLTIPKEFKCANFKWREELDPSVIESIREEDPEFYRRYEKD
jgi:hypothetical protein